MRCDFLYGRSMSSRNATSRGAAIGRSVRFGFTGALVVALMLPSAAVRAQSIDLCVHEMSDDQIDSHTQLIVGALRDHRTHARAWRFGWLAAYTAIAVGALAIIAPGIDRSTDDGQARWLGYIGAGTAASVAAARLAFYPMPDVWGVRRIERMPSGTREERIAQARYAESVLSSAGDWQKLMTGTTSYAIALGWGIAWGTALSIKYDNAFTSALAFVGSPVLGIATVLTAPNWAAVYADNLRGGVCGHSYGEVREGAMVEDEGLEGEEEVEEEDDWQPPEDLEEEAPLDALGTSSGSPTVMVYPTFGGAGLNVTF